MLLDPHLDHSRRYSFDTRGYTVNTYHILCVGVNSVISCSVSVAFTPRMIRIHGILLFQVCFYYRKFPEDGRE